MLYPAKPPATVIVDAESHHEPANDTEKGGVNNNSSEPPSADAEVHSRDPVSEHPPLPDEVPPPLPDEQPPAAVEDDGWEPVWDESVQAFYFYNRHTKTSQWENPRVPEASNSRAAKLEDVGPPGASATSHPRKPLTGGYDPAIHGDYDPNADYAKAYDPPNDQTLEAQTAPIDPAAIYAATGAFNRFTGKWQSADINPDKFSDENKSRRQMNAFFDVDAAANAHDGRSLKAERSGKKLTKAELKAYREKRREKKEEKRRAWLRD